MNITIIYGGNKKTNTYNCVKLLLKKIKSNTTINVTEFHLCQNSFHHGYFLYYHNLIKIHHDINDLGPITDSIISSDLIILASQIHACDIDSEMKTLLKNLYLHFKNNKPYSMRDKIGLTICTSAGAGLFNSIRTLKKNLLLLGINNIFKFSRTIYETNWNDIDISKKKQINRKIIKLSRRILNLYNTLYELKSKNFIKKAALQFRPALRNNSCNIISLNSWKKQQY